MFPGHFLGIQDNGSLKPPTETAPSQRESWFVPFPKDSVVSGFHCGMSVETISLLTAPPLYPYSHHRTTHYKVTHPPLYPSLSQLGAGHQAIPTPLLKAIRSSQATSLHPLRAFTPRCRLEPLWQHLVTPWTNMATLLLQRIPNSRCRRMCPRVPACPMAIMFWYVHGTADAIMSYSHMIEVFVIFGT